MDSVAMAEELAWLIKDNLPCKHLVLSAEEAFVAFLHPQETASVGRVLTLEPMAAYHRMLLHRLADIFRLAHESIGDGEDRRLVLERCEDSYIPDVLVSDILECNEDAALSTSSQNAPLILKRNTDRSDFLKYAQAQSAQISFEERQAAYLAARERIFSEDLGESVSQSAIPRPRSVPVVARRMIAHALGKRILAEEDFKAAAANTEPVVTRELDITCSSLDAEEPKAPTVMDSTCAATVGSNSDDTNPQVEPSKVFECVQTEAAKRMFAQALGLGSSKSSCRVSSRPAEKKVTDPECSQPIKSYVSVKESSSPGPQDTLKSGRTANSSSSLCDQSGQPAVLGTAQLEQGRAAHRMLAQALGFRSLSIVAERSKSS
eukprot:c11011_g1_i1 orf=128-1255(+)